MAFAILNVHKEADLLTNDVLVIMTIPPVRKNLVDNPLPFIFRV